MATKPPSQESGKQDSVAAKANGTATSAGAGRPEGDQALKPAGQEDQAQAALALQQQLLESVRGEIGAMVAAAMEPLKGLFLDSTGAISATLQEQRSTEVLPQAKAELTREEAARLVQRRKVISDKGAERVVMMRLFPEELLSWHDHGTHVVVVTVDGQKFSNADTE